MFSKLRFFFKIFVVRTGSATLKAAWVDWGGDLYSILIDGCVKSSVQVGGHIQRPFFLPLRRLKTETLWGISVLRRVF